MSTLADYAGRTYDVAAFAGQAARGDRLLEPTLLDRGGAICTGAQKAAQWFALEFLKEAGSMPYNPRSGCDFMTRVRLGTLRQESDVFTAFGLAGAQVLDALLDAEPPGAPADERLTKADLARVTFAPGWCTLVVRLTTMAGPLRPVILPIPITP
jgi:hypothetical protein